MAEHQPFSTLAIKSNYSIAANYKINWIKYIIYSSLLIVLVCACVFVRVLTKIFAFTIQSIQIKPNEKETNNNNGSLYDVALSTYNSIQIDLFA